MKPVATGDLVKIVRKVLDDDKRSAHVYVIKVEYPETEILKDTKTNRNLFNSVLRHIMSK
jgi:hypothetical protein